MNKSEKEESKFWLNETWIYYMLCKNRQDDLRCAIPSSSWSESHTQKISHLHCPVIKDETTNTEKL